MLLLALACSSDEPSGPASPGDDDDTDVPVFDYPLDDTLRFQHLQAKGTHNSYHVETTEIDEWNYTHSPLDVQLGDEGVRQFELDTTWIDDEWKVLHVPLIDEGTTCETFVDCVRVMKDWSDANRAHHPLFTLVEVKDVFDDETGPDRYDQLVDDLLAVWPESRLITPAQVRGDHPTLRDAVDTDGWPTLGELRGTALFVLHEGGPWRDHMLDNEGPYFPDAGGDPDQDYSAVHSMNNPYDTAIADVVGRNHLVRTRTDSDTQEARDNDTAKRDQAFVSGAHFVSTDFPAPVDWTEYVVEIPGGTPSRCNPLTAPKNCTSEAIEDPAFFE